MHIDDLKKVFSGNIVVPGDENYEQASMAFASKGEPAVVVYPLSAQDVAAAISYATDNSLILSVRSGGHSVAGFCNNVGGVVIDMKEIRQVKVLDAEKNIVSIGSGGTWGDVAKELEKHGLGLSSGDTRTVGVGGLTLAGGIGWMVRKYGLTIDSLVAAEVVTADGNILRVSATENTDLFWAIRGGGGNFGIVTNFEFAAHSVGKVYSGSYMYSLETLPELLTRWRDYMRTADNDLTAIINIFPSFGGNPPAARLTVCYANNDGAKAREALEPLKGFGTVLHEDVIEKNYSEVLEEAHPPKGMKIVVKNVLVDTLSDELIAAIEMARTKKPDMILQIRALGGAMKQVPRDATAFAHRDCEIMLLSPTFLPSTVSDDEEEKALAAWKTLAAFGNGAYMNFLSTHTEEDLNLIYPESTFNRLAEIKKTYDPENVFDQNYNIKPAR